MPDIYQTKTGEAEQKLVQWPALESRILLETSERANRLNRLQTQVNELFPNEASQPIRDEIIRSFDVPQFGEYHNEGLLMDSHLERMLLALEDMKQGRFEAGVPAYLAEYLGVLVHEHEEALKKYIFLHDISKADLLRLNYEDSEKPSRDITLEAWKEMVGGGRHDDPAAIQAYCQSNGIRSLSYFHEDQMHGRHGAEKIEKYADSLGVPPMLVMMVNRHEAAHHFGALNADSYRKIFANFSPEEELWVIAASYLDTKASLGQDGQPNMGSFLNMITSIRQYHMAKTASEVLMPDGKALEGYSAKKLTKGIQEVRKAKVPSSFQPEDLMADLEISCREPEYSAETFLQNLETVSISPEMAFTPEEIEMIRELLVAKRTFREADLNPIRSKMGEKNQILREILSKSVNGTIKPADRLPLSDASLFDLRERTEYVATEKIRNVLMAGPLSEKNRAKLFASCFEGSGVYKKLQLLDEAGLLDELLPDFARSRKLMQDPRFHGVETVGEHAFRASVAMDALLASTQPFSDSRYETLLRYTAFLHDIGKNEDEKHSPEERKKQGKSARGGGYRFEEKRPGEDFARVSFSGHEKYGAERFGRIMKEMQAALNEDERFTEEEIRMASLWIKSHMRAVSASHDLKQFDEDQLVDQIVENVYPPELLNARIPLEDALRGALMIQNMEMILSHDLAPDAAWIDAWNQVMAQAERQIPALRQRNRSLLTVPLLSGDDLIELGIPDEARSGILNEVRLKQLTAEVTNRENALITAIGIAKANGIEISEEKFDRLLEVGAFRRLSARMENLRVVSEEERGEEGAKYMLRHYETTPLRQFPDDVTVEQIEAEIRNGAYPNLVRHLETNSIPIAEIAKLLSGEVGFSNLLQLEFFVREYCHDGETITNVGVTKSPVVKSIEIERAMSGDPKKRKILVNNGYQGVSDHTGAGSIHIGQQRLEALKAGYQKPGEAEHEMVRRFFDEAVIHVVGTARLEIPSDYDPEKYSILLAPIKNSENQQFAGVIVDKSGASIRVITTLFQASPKELKGDLKNMLRRLREKAKFSDDQLNLLMISVNEMLEGVGQASMTLADLERQKQQPQPAQKKEKKQQEPTQKQAGVAPFLGRVGLGRYISEVNKALREAGLTAVPGNMNEIAESAKKAVSEGRDDIPEFIVSKIREGLSSTLKQE